MSHQVRQGSGRDHEEPVVGSVSGPPDHHRVVNVVRTEAVRTILALNPNQDVAPLRRIRTIGAERNPGGFAVDPVGQQTEPTF